MTNEYEDFRREENTYRISGGEQLPRDDYEPELRAEPVHDPAPETAAPAAEPVKKKSFFRRAGVRVAALLLAVALVGGLCGYGGAALYRSGKSLTGSRATLQESAPRATEVAVKKVTGQTAMTPAEVYAATVNSMVSIHTSLVSTNVFGQTVEGASAGSGFVITSDGYIVTNYHVIKGATSINVTTYNGDTYEATVVGGDSDYDVAVLKVEARGLQAVTLGSSSDLHVGDTVLAIGNPLGELTFSMSMGIVSCLDRAINIDGVPFNMIQVDASVNPGNSGGALLNLYGEVVGIVSAKYSSDEVEGLGFALPMDDVQTIITDIMENGAVTNKAYLAITAGTMTESMGAQYQIAVTKGVFVYSVVKGGAGDKAGLQMGDVITKVGDTAVSSMEELAAVKKTYRAGDTVTLTVYRDGAYLTTDLTFDVQPETTGQTEQSEQNAQGGQEEIPGWEDFYSYFFGGRGWPGWGYGG